MKNKYFFISSIIISLLFALPKESNAQFFKKLGDKAKAKIEGEADKRSEKMVNKKIDEGYDKAEDKIDGVGKKKDKGKKEAKDEKKSKTDDEIEYEIVEEPTTPQVNWSKFDFIPGDTVIFEDHPAMDEENGEFPSKWDLVAGVVEIIEIDGENAIVFYEGGYSHGIVPYLKNAKEDYLPEVFTIEFDGYFPPNIYSNRYYLHLYDKKNQRYGDNSTIQFNVNNIEVDASNKTYPGKERGNRDEIGGWRHFSVAYTKGKLKVYMDDVRLINIPHYEGTPTGITLTGGFDNAYIKNFRLAKGGVKYYDRVLSDGKIIVSGIKFDINKATLRPESMGPINKIYKLMVKNPDIKFSVEGHTDSDGDDATNLTLSKARGKSVMDKLISMGIDKSRLKSNGFGESKPLDTNGTPEGKANNRRVEFVKF